MDGADSLSLFNAKESRRPLGITTGRGDTGCNAFHHGWARLEVEGEAYADLEIVLDAGVQAGEDIIGPSAKRQVGIEEVVHTAAGLEGAAVHAGMGNLRIDVRP